MTARLRWFGRRWWAEWNWLIDKTPGLRDQLNFWLARDSFNYRRAPW